MQQPVMNEALRPGSMATPFSTFFWALMSGDLATAEAQLADDIEWDLMPNNQVLKGKTDVIPWLRAGAASGKEPVAISNLATNEWGVFELWNIGTVTKELVEFSKQQGWKQQGWPVPEDADSLIGKQYKVAECFVYFIDADRKITLMREYLDAGSVWAQFR